MPIYIRYITDDDTGLEPVQYIGDYDTCRGVAVGIHYSHPVEVFQRAALSARCNIIVVDSAEDLAKVLKIRSNLPDLNAIVQYGKEEGAPQKIPGVMTVSDQ